MDLEAALKDLDEQPEPSVFVDETLEAFCEVRPRGPRAVPAAPSTPRVPLSAILTFINQNAG